MGAVSGMAEYANFCLEVPGVCPTYHREKEN